ncbi:MAG TPA: sn-glycerol-3-phosphate ABC transporter ATP-binding protein UgpC, partial [Acidimicrobiia bacterium]|nr:sn-glycerol-3-phosphate ABC transporter ATP-binding protein UgpC [Acidimicrobiia bacterium]
MSGIVLSGVTKEFPGGAVAVSSLDLEIADGEFLVLVGPSGSGKTTVLRMVGGLEEATSGEIRIGGRDVTNLAPRDRDIAMVFQTYALYPHMTVAQNMAFGLKLRGTPKDEIRRRVDETAALLGLSDLLDRKPRALSGGQRQRVAMGRAIVREPAAFLMDEPLSNLDAKLRVQMRAEISRLHHRLRTTTLYVTHDQTEAITMADRVAVMRDGTLQQLDVPSALYDDPVNLFVAGFIGSPAMNVVTAVLTAADGRVFARFGDHRLVVPEPVLARRPGARAVIAAGGEVALGLRPEDLEDAEFASNAGPDETLQVTVDLAEPLGAETILHFDVTGVPFTARVSPRTSVRTGDPVKLAVDVERLHLFDPASGQSL